MASPVEIKWLALIGECLVKSTGALAISILLAVLFRRRSASLRHFVLSLFLISLIFFPFLSYFPSGWETRWLPSWLDAQESSRVKGESPAVGGRLWLDDSAGLKPAAPNDRALDGRPEAESTKGSGVAAWGKILAAGLFLVWLAGVVVFLSRIALGISAASRLTREGERLADSTWLKLVQRFLSAIGLRRRVSLISHHHVSVPLTWGLWKPVVIMPAGAVSWDEDKRCSALFHELSHVKRADFLVTMVVRLSLALFWLNPLTWVVFRMMKEEQEKACDELALRVGIKPSAYAASLLSIRRSAGRPGYSSAVVLGMSGRSQLNDRLVTILRQKLALKEVKMKTKIMISVLAFLAVSFIGLARSSSSSDYENAVLSRQAPAESRTENAPQEPAVQENQEKKQPEPAEKKAEAADKEADKDKEKDTDKKPVKVILKKGIKIEKPITVTVIEGDKVKTIKVDEPVVLRKDSAGTKILVTSKGKEIVICEGPEVTVEIVGDRTTVLKEPEMVNLDKEATVLVEDKEKGSKVILVEKPHILIRKCLKAHDFRFNFEPLKEGLSIGVPLHLKNLEEKIGKIEESLKIVDEHQPDVEKALQEADQVIKEVLDKELKQKLEKIHEQLSLKLETKNAVREQVLEEVRKSLEELRVELEGKAEKLKGIEMTMKMPKIGLAIEHPAEPLDVEEDWKVEHEDLENGVIVTVMDEKKGKLIYVWESGLGENKKEAYERAVEKMKKGLPEGYGLQSEFKEKTGTIVIKITAPDGKAESRDLLKKLIDELKEELKSREPGN